MRAPSENVVIAPPAEVSEGLAVALPPEPHHPRLTSDQWEQWEVLLNEPPRDLPGLREFLARPSIFTDE